MNAETNVSNSDAQEKLSNQKDENGSQESDKKIEIVSEVSNLLENLVKKVDKSNDSDDEENPSDDENIFKTESKVNDMGKPENDITREDNQNEETNKDKNAKQDEQEEIRTNEEQSGNSNEEQVDNSNAFNEKNIKEIKDTKEERSEIETTTVNTIDDVINSPSDEENLKDDGALESLFHNHVNEIINGKVDMPTVINNGKVDISTETDHKEKKISNKKISDQDNSQSIDIKDQQEINSNNNTNNSKKNNNASSNNNNNNSEYSDAELHNALDAMLKKKLLPDIKIRSAVIEYAHRYCDEKMMNEEYDEAINVDLAIDIMFTSMDESNVNVQKQQVNENVLRRLQMTKERKEEVEKKWNDRINSQKEINTQKQLEMSKAHEKEKAAFIEEWNNPQMLVAFSKPSAKLFHLRKQQKTLALVHDFEGAKILKNEADQLERQETMEGLRKAESSMKNQYMMLLDRQNREMTCLIDSSRTSIEKLEMFKIKELSSIENTQKVLQSRLPPMPNSISASSSNSSVSSQQSQSVKKNKLALNPTVIVPNVNSNSAMKSRSLSSSLIARRRARSQLSSYKATNETWRLKLKMNDVSKTIRSVEPASKNRQTSTL